MGHINTGYKENDITVSFFLVITNGNNVTQVVAHKHKKMNKIIQFGGHIEKNENVTIALLREIEEEIGVKKEHISIYQPLDTPNNLGHSIINPVPFSVSTHPIGPEHFHTDLSYVVAVSEGVIDIDKIDGANESKDIRYINIDNIDSIDDEFARLGYAYASKINTAQLVPASSFNVTMPSNH